MERPFVPPGDGEQPINTTLYHGARVERLTGPGLAHLPLEVMLAASIGATEVTHPIEVNRVADL